MEYLITDPSGIGESLILRLIEQQESVFTIYPTPKEVPMSFLGKINLKYGFLKFDQERDFTKVLPKKVKYVIHSYDMYTGPFTTVFRSNPCATLSLLDWARKAGVEKFIFLSSGEVYGHGSSVDEKAPFNPHSFYAATKFETEYLFRYYQSAVSIITLRLFFPFGKKMRDGMVKQLVEAIRVGKGFETEYSSISPTWTYDVVDPLINVIEGKKSGVYNICGSRVDVRDLAQKISQVMKKALQEIRVGKIELTGSNTRAVKDLGFKETNLDEALLNAFGG